MPTNIGTVNIHIGDGDYVDVLSKAELREALIGALTAALSEAKHGHLSVLDLGNGTVRLHCGLVPVYAHGAMFLPSVRVNGECQSCGMDWAENMDYCTGCESE